MGVYSEILTKEQKEAILQNRLGQLVSEAYQHELNLELMQVIGNEEGRKNVEDALKVAEQAIILHRDKLAELIGAEAGQ